MRDGKANVLKRIVKHHKPVWPRPRWAPARHLLGGRWREPSAPARPLPERFEKLRKRKVQGRGEPRHGRHADVALATFDAADVISMKAGPFREAFLRNLLLATQVADAPPDGDAQIHSHESYRRGLNTIGLHTIVVTLAARKAPGLVASIDVHECQTPCEAGVVVRRGRREEHLSVRGIDRISHLERLHAAQTAPKGSSSTIVVEVRGGHRLNSLDDIVVDRSKHSPRGNRKLRQLRKILERRRLTAPAVAISSREGGRAHDALNCGRQ